MSTPVARSTRPSILFPLVAVASMRLGQRSNASRESNPSPSSGKAVPIAKTSITSATRPRSRPCAASTDAACELYTAIVPQVVRVSTPEVAEACKILENTYRAVNIALVNELKIVFDRMGIDIWEVIAAASTKPFGFMPFYPGPGLGGHCIPIDPHYLAWKLKALNFQARFIGLAAEINGMMPTLVARMVSDGLNRSSKSVRDSKILIMGVAYKKNVSDCRESPALDVMRLLSDKGAILSYNDPLVPSLRLGRTDAHEEDVDAPVEFAGIGHHAVVRRLQVDRTAAEPAAGPAEAADGGEQIQVVQPDAKRLRSTHGEPGQRSVLPVRDRPEG